jgi:hypothetical protein
MSGNRVSIVRIETSSGLHDWWGQNSSTGRIKNFIFSAVSRQALGPTQPLIKWVPGSLSPGVKWLVHEADHSLPTSAEVKKTWICTCTHSIRLHGLVLHYLSTGRTLPWKRQESCNVVKQILTFLGRSVQKVGTSMPAGIMWWQIFLTDPIQLSDQTMGCFLIVFN